MPEIIEIVEITARDVQGVLKPIEGRGSDDHRYFIKQMNTDKRPLTCEWVAGRLAQLLKLPVPEFCIVTLSEELIEFVPHDLKNYDLIAGPAFASRVVEQASDLYSVQIPSIPQELRLRIALFDWWIMNPDRWHGNFNLLWNPSGRQVNVIDHHQAFSNPPVRPIRQHHVFTEDMIPVPTKDRKRWLKELKTAYDQLDAIYAELPTEWTRGNPLPIASVKVILERAFDAEAAFWRFEV